MQAIITKYLPATNTRGSRIKASCERGAIIISYPDELNMGEPVHCYAANALCERFVAEDAKKYGSKPESNPWSRKRVSGQIPSGEFVHVFTS